MIYIGIDPGAKGAMAILYETGYIHIIPFDGDKYANELAELTQCEESCRCCLEQVHAIPGNGLTSTWNFAENYGFIRGLMEANGIPYQTVTPQKWKKEFSLTSDKSDSITVCQRLFPKVNLLRTERSRKPDNNFAEACLMAEYAKRHF